MFEEQLIGHYKNTKQAYSNPSLWPHINLLFEIEEEGKVFTSKSWYDYQGAHKPYRHARHTWHHIHKDIVKIHTYDLIKDREGCPYLFVKMDGGTWWGETEGPCMHNKILVTSVARFNGEDYWALDNGRDKTGKLIWGTPDHQGEYHFKKVNK